MAGAVDDKATRRSNGPVRVTLPESRPSARVDRPSTGRVSRPSGAYFPSTAAAVRKSNFDAGNAYAKGDTVGALGASARKIATVPMGIVDDTVMRPLATVTGGAARFLGSLIGSDGSTTVNQAYTPPKPVEAALASGRGATATLMSPADEMKVKLHAILGNGPMTLREAQAISGMMPASPKPVTAKETVLDTTAQISKAIYADTIKDIQTRRAAGELDQVGTQAETAKATNAFFLRNTGLVANPLSFAQANMLPDPDEDN